MHSEGSRKEEKKSSPTSLSLLIRKGRIHDRDGAIAHRRGSSAFVWPR